MEMSCNQEMGENPANPSSTHGQQPNQVAEQYQLEPPYHSIQQGYSAQGNVGGYKYIGQPTPEAAVIGQPTSEAAVIGQPASVAAVIGQPTGQAEAQHAAITLPDGDGSVVVEMSPDDFENVITATMQAGGVTLHIRTDGDNQQTVQQVTIPSMSTAGAAPNIVAASTDAVANSNYHIHHVPVVNSEQPATSSQAQAADHDATLNRSNTVEHATPPRLPEGLRYGEVANRTRIKSLGVFASKDFKAGEKFGPFTGEFVKEAFGCNDPCTWEICVKGRTWFYIDGASDPSNWMKCVDVARSKEEQNLEAFQFYGNIFFRTTSEVEEGTELRVFYDDDYGSNVGFHSGLGDLHFDYDSGRFDCQYCSCRYANAKSLIRHIKFEHNKENNFAPDENCPANKNKVSDNSPQSQEKAEPPSDNKIAGYLEERRNNLKTDRGKRQQKGGKKRGRPPKQVLRITTPPPAKKKRGRPPKQVLKITTPPPVKKKRGRPPKVVKEEPEPEPEPEQVFACKKCNKVFPSGGALKEHAAFHNETKSLKPVCEVCGLECKHKRGLKQHMLSHIADAFHCQHCKRYFRRKGAYVYHLRHDHGEYVGEKWMRQNQEEKMARYVGPEEQGEKQPFHPEVPKDMLGKRIVEASKKPKIFKCKYCPKKFAANHEVFRHEKMAHMNAGRYVCEFCFANFMEESRLILHKRRHTKERPYKCAECPLSFSSESALKRHEPEHRGERPHRCDVCGSSFRSRPSMKTHKRRVHSTVLMKCKYCEQSFKLKTSLTRHEQRHKGIRPFVCLTCGKAFGTKYSLQAHEHIHTGEKPFECKVCHQRFALNHLLSYHMIRHDNEKETVDSQSTMEVGTTVVSLVNPSDTVECLVNPSSSAGSSVDPGEELIRSQVLQN